MRAPTLALARDEIPSPSIERHVANATSPDPPEGIVSETALRLGEVIA